MNAPRVVSRDEWLVARKELLTAEREAAEERMALAAERAALPAVEIDKEYLFEGRRQLIVYHFMFDPGWDEGCKFCSLIVDNVGHTSHLRARQTTFAMVSRAPLPKIEPFRTRMGWTIPWYSSLGSDFNVHVTLDEGGLSVFLRDGQTVYHTYSTYADGTDLLHGTLMYLDLTPLGRQGDGELRHHDRYGH